MATGVLFFGWGQPFAGREQKALQVFGEAVQYWTRLQQEGVIESFIPVNLEPHGGELNGCCLLLGDREKLNALRTQPEFIRLNLRAALVVERFGVVGGGTGETLQREFEEFGQHAQELA